MISKKQNFSGRAAGLALILAGIALGSAPSFAAEMTAQQIIDGLKLAPKTRGLSQESRPSLTTNDVSFVKRVRGMKRSLSLGDRKEMDALVAKRPAIDLDINFEYNSAELTPNAVPQLESLGVAMTSDQLGGSIMVLGGHTDGKGGDDFNQSLSEHRAETVKRFLVEKYHIPAENIVTAGYGKQGLKNATDPFAPENRRVQISNVEGQDEASR
jgi:outer membrane protein OmpA-like peptidoglycan-associated protein